MNQGNFDFGNLMSQMQETQKKMDEIQEKLKDRVVEGSAGGGMVTANVNGQKELLAIDIDEEIAAEEDLELLEDMVVAAVNQGMEKADDLAEEEMNKVAGDLGIPGGMQGLMDMLG